MTVRHGCAAALAAFGTAAQARHFRGNDASVRERQTAGDLAEVWIAALHATVASHRHDHAVPASDTEAIAPRLQAIEQTAREMALTMEFGFLRNTERKLLSIGFLANAGTLDANCYDLLASEARLACFVAIAKSDIPARE
jgi:cyclic beta-1,2-glucan synthetase